MKIQSLKISNVTSFKYSENIDDATTINFDDDLNIFIGENGSGKSTFLEVIAFLLRRVIFLPYTVQYSENQIDSLPAHMISNTIVLAEQGNLGSFKLAKNWNYESLRQQVKVCIKLGEVDKKNIENIHNNFAKLQSGAGRYTNHAFMDIVHYEDELEFLVDINSTNNQFTVSNVSNNYTWSYLKDFNLYNHLIDMYNFGSVDDKILPLAESFAILGGYRNYSTIGNTVTLSSDATLQLRGLKQNDQSKGVRSFDGAEPSIFNMVRIAVANEHVQELRESGKDSADQVNPVMLQKINKKLELIDLRCELKLTDINSWSYTFNFIDTRRDRIISNIDDLSAGQKSLLHLIFEAYGRGEYEGGLIIIDEPELHLHFQFQSAYLKIMNAINMDSKNQYIVVTHSESLISSQTISTVSRLIRDTIGDTMVFQPTEIDQTRKQLIKILDNTRSTYALFARKVLLVEGDTDRYFFQNVIEKLYETEYSTTAVLDIGGKSNYSSWNNLFKLYGIEVNFIGDFDNVFSLPQPDGNPLVEKSLERSSMISAVQKKLDSLAEAQKASIMNSYEAFKNNSDIPNHTDYGKFLDFSSTVRRMSKLPAIDYIKELKISVADVESKIDGAYADKIFILKKGSIEAYTNSTSHDIESMVDFCDNHLESWLDEGSDEASEIKNILNIIYATD